MSRPFGSKNVKWDKEELRRLYWDEKLSCQKIAERYGTVFQAVLKAMQRFVIPRRTITEATTAELHYRWAGGRNKTSTGYIEIYMPEHHRAGARGYVKEHILVWEEANGRRLRRDEIVHHLNGIKDDNRPLNLLALRENKHRRWIPALQEHIRKLEVALKRCSQDVMELDIGEEKYCETTTKERSQNIMEI